MISIPSLILDSLAYLLHCSISDITFPEPQESSAPEAPCCRSTKKLNNWLTLEFNIKYLGGKYDWPSLDKVSFLSQSVVAKGIQCIYLPWAYLEHPEAVPKIGMFVLSEVLNQWITVCLLTLGKCESCSISPKKSEPSEAREHVGGKGCKTWR